MLNGVTGKYCIVDLSTGETEIVAPGEAFYRKYLSGYGLGAAVITERQKAGVDALAPGSHLGFCSGLLTGTGAFFSGRFMVVGKSPLTGGWGDANAGGFFSRAIKRSGYDAIFFTGAAEKPVWVVITNGDVEIRNADGLWGKDILETETCIREVLGDRNVQIASIGVSGEQRSLISGIATDGARIAARSGLGAVMGSKNLKALALRGKTRVKVADPERLKAINSAFIADYKKSSFIDRMTMKVMNFLSRIIARTGISVPSQPSLIREILRKYGTSGLTTYSAMVGDMPIKNWGGVGYKEFPVKRASRGSDENVIKYQTRRYACQSCPLGCGGIIEIKKGKYRGEKGHKPEYETIGSFGGMLLQDDFDAIVEINEMCNRAGIDTISTGAAVAFATECFENGIIDETTTGGLQLGWGKTAEVLELVDLIIKREGFGELLADGVKRAAERIGNGSEQYAVHAGGQELPMHDPRLDPGFAIAYECEPTPGRHTVSCYLYASLFGLEKRFPAAARMVKSGKGRAVKDIRRFAAGTYYMQLLNCGGMCLFGAITSHLPVVEYMNAVTGWAMSADEYLEIGQRILSLRKSFNVREGITGSGYRIHDRAIGTTPLKSGPLKGNRVDLPVLMDEFYRTVGWDREKGGPTPEKMAALGLDPSGAEFSN